MANPLSFVVRQGDLDVNSRPLQLLDTVHRTALMPVGRGKAPEPVSHFKDPLGIASYYGYGADGWHYEGGVQGRAWRPRQSIDDFADKVTDMARWASFGPDLSEGGIDRIADPPFGLRLFAAYGGPAPEVYDRVGMMVYSPPGSGILSGRVSTLGPTLPSLSPDNGVWLGIQPFGNVLNYVFVGYLNTAAFPSCLAHGEVIAGVPVVYATFPLPGGLQSANVAIEYNSVAGTSTAYFNALQTMVDLGGPGWGPIGPPAPLGIAWAGSPNAVPRVHATFPALSPVGLRHSLADVRVEVGSGPWDGQCRASWFLEASDPTNPTDMVGVRQECPDELLCVWERDASGNCHLTLVDADDPANPALWRRWKGLGLWFDARDRDPAEPFSPGWIGAAEGHVAMTRNTRYQASGDAADAAGEVWVASLRWDKVSVFDVSGVGEVLSYVGPGGEVLRETGSWGSRRWISQQSYFAPSGYDRTNQPSAPFVGTCRNVLAEVMSPALSYGCDVRRCDDDLVYVAYGVREVPATYGLPGKYFAGTIRLGEGPALSHPRWLFQKDSATATLWDRTCEAWIVAGLTSTRDVYWVQAIEGGARDELQGVLCRRNFSFDVQDNQSTSPYVEVVAWGDALLDLVGGVGFNADVSSSDPAGNEVVALSSGWLGGSWLTVLWYDPGDPPNSTIRTYGGGDPVEPLSDPCLAFPPGVRFPTWLAYRNAGSPAASGRCRVAQGSGQGADSYVARLDGAWLAYGKTLGVATATLAHEAIRWPALDRDDFVVEVAGRLLPPFAAGYGYGAISGMNPTQGFKFYVGVDGSRGLRARVGLECRGDSAGTGGFLAYATMEWVDGSGLNQLSSSVKLGTAIFLLGGADVRFRIVRDGRTIRCLCWDPNVGGFVSVLEADAIQVACVGMIGSSVNDSTGLACSAGVEVDGFAVGPPDDPRGRAWVPPASLRTLPHRAGSVCGGTVPREAFPLGGSGRVVVADGWAFPGLMPSP